MDNRWQMNRIGFVNFWLYDEEIFEFSDGKLLLKGQNGSGKSITTQSIIPFILDGDRTPSRLDPFGSSDRKMEYYFLGDNEKDDVTGYLFLEFKKQNTEQYRTIGIGQRAQKGKPMQFWGFIILDNQRIGYDMFLYQKIGTRKIPYTKQDLKKKLGDGNIFAETQKEYMAFVNKYIFGFPRIEQYEQFIKLLIKVRAPKLSKEFKPSKVYDILNDSLQTLSDDDLHAMVDAMEDMDGIQSRLENLKETYSDLQNIKTEYDRYNRYMLSKKAEAFLDAKSDSDSISADLKKKEKEFTSGKEEVKKLNDENEILRIEKSELESEKSTINISDIEENVNQRQKYENARNEEIENKNRKSEKISKSKDKIYRLEVQQKNILKETDDYKYNIENLFLQLDEQNDILNFEKHNDVKELPESNDYERISRNISDELNRLSKNINTAFDAVNRFEEKTNECNNAEKELEKRSKNKSIAEKELNSARKLEDESRDSITEQYYIFADEHKELILNSETVQKLSELIKQYKSPADYGEILNITNSLYNEKYNELYRIKIDIQSEQDSLIKSKKSLENELQQLINMKEPVPERSKRVQETRKILTQNGINFIPFYEAVDFADNISADEQNMLECQLTDSGLLDSLIVAENDYEKATQLLKGYSDVIIHTDGNGTEKFGKLKISDDIHSELKFQTEKILADFSEKRESDSKFVVSPDGYFRNGILEGYSTADSDAMYIGVNARRRNKEKQIAEKQKEIDVCTEQLNALRNETDGINQRISTLEKDKNALPKYDDLDRSIDMSKECEMNYNSAVRDFNAQEKILLDLSAVKTKCEQDMITACKILPYARNTESYKEVREAVSDYKNIFIELDKTVTKYNNAKIRYENVQYNIDSENDIIDETQAELRNIIRKVESYDKLINQINEFLNNPEVKAKAERLTQINRMLRENESRYSDNKTKIAVAENNISRLETEIENAKIKSAEVMTITENLKTYFEEELSLNLVFDEVGNSSYETAKKAVGCIHNNDKDKSVSDMITLLHNKFQKYNSNIAIYGATLEDCFENSENTNTLRKRQRIYATLNGQKLYFNDFCVAVKSMIESTEQLIQEKDRELFENILADTLSRKLNARISESRRWIKDMSALMQNMDTSMGLTFSLDWKARSAENDNELEISELEKLLARDRELLTTQDIDRVSSHFRNKIHIAKQTAEENGETVNYSDLVRDALDYRKWFEFKMYYYRNSESKKELTNGAFNRFSGGEKAMAMYVPLFAAVNAQYKKAENNDHPRIIALDEAFAGVDDKNISSMFELVQKLDFDYIINSQVLWGCYETVPSLRIAELLRPANSDVVTVINYYWNGHERILNE
ncbi:MAG: TIGR02680 family protein [Clostridia bacterium]|nr:TIGR02680 family protein [Clostridia bacterium]